jgi:hypothetical protein
VGWKQPACLSLPPSLLLLEKSKRNWVAATHALAFKHMHDLLLHGPGTIPLPQNPHMKTSDKPWIRYPVPTSASLSWLFLPPKLLLVGGKLTVKLYVKQIERTQGKKGKWGYDAMLNRTWTHGLYWFPSLDMPRKQMTFVGHSHMYPDGLHGSFQMACPCGNAKVPFSSHTSPELLMSRAQPLFQHH